MATHKTRALASKNAPTAPVNSIGWTSVTGNRHACPVDQAPNIPAPPQPVQFSCRSAMCLTHSIQKMSCHISHLTTAGHGLPGLPTHLLQKTCSPRCSKQTSGTGLLGPHSNIHAKSMPGGKHLPPPHRPRPAPLGPQTMGGPQNVDVKPLSQEHGVLSPCCHVNQFTCHPITMHISTMNIWPPELPQKLRIWQQNVHKSKTPQTYVINTTNPKDWDVIALQEPWIDSFRNSCSSQYWRVIYPANFYDEDRSRVRSILLINTNISTDCYSVLPIMHTNIMAIHFRGDNKFLSVFNVYNEITNNDTLKVLENYSDLNECLICLTTTDCVIWLGDFNQHHPVWEDNNNKHLFEPKDRIAPLINLLNKYDMLLALPKGKPMLQMSAGNWTRLDNVWRCNTLDDPILCCDTVPAIHPPPANHLPIITILDLPFPRSQLLHL